MQELDRLATLMFFEQPQATLSVLTNCAPTAFHRTHDFGDPEEREVIVEHPGDERSGLFDIRRWDAIGR